MENEYPRASDHHPPRPPGRTSLYYGPFPSRTAAEKFANDSLDFFKMRRCVTIIPTRLSRLHLFGNENVSRALLQRLH